VKHASGLELAGVSRVLALGTTMLVDLNMVNTRPEAGEAFAGLTLELEEILVV
jgi:hypothetical protein